MNISVQEFIEAYSSVIGVGYDNPCAYQLINKARLAVYPLGDWVGTMDYIAFDASSGTLTLPSNIDYIRGARDYCGQIIDIESGHVTKELYCSCAGNVITKMIDKVYCPFQLTENEAFYAYAVNKRDAGKTIRIQYETSGTRVDESFELLHLEPTRLSRVPSKILRITKPVTVGAVAIASGNDCQNPSAISHLAYNEVSPAYSRYCFKCSGYVVMEVKKRMIPYTLEGLDEMIDIHPEALSILVAAMKSRDDRKDGWQKDYSASISLAVNFLRQELVNEESTNDAQYAVQFHNNEFDNLVAIDTL